MTVHFKTAASFSVCWITYKKFPTTYIPGDLEDISIPVSGTSSYCGKKYIFIKTKWKERKQGSPVQLILQQIFIGKCVYIRVPFI